MKVTLRSSSGISIVVWREQREFHAQRSDSVDDTQICLGVDLFEVIAELAELDLESHAGAAEATALAADAQRRLTAATDGDADAAAAHRTAGDDGAISAV